MRSHKLLGDCEANLLLIWPADDLCMAEVLNSVCEYDEQKNSIVSTQREPAAVA